MFHCVQCKNWLRCCAWTRDRLTNSKVDHKVHSVSCSLRVQRKNWPRCCPFMRHSISEDVPLGMRGMVRRGYFGWILAAAGFFWNAVTITMLYVTALGFMV